MIELMNVGVWAVFAGIALPVAALIVVSCAQVVGAARDTTPQAALWPPLGARPWLPRTLPPLDPRDGHTGPLDPVEAEIAAEWSWTYGPGEWPLYAELCRKRQEDWHFSIGNESLDVAQLGQHRVRDSCPACDEVWNRAGVNAAMATASIPKRQETP